MKRTIISVIFIGLSISAFGQSTSKFTLRQSFQSKTDKAEPAIITFTKPKDKNSSWLLNAAIGYNIDLKKANVTIDPYIEYHRNTLIDKVQDNWQAGVSAQSQLMNLSRSSWSPILITAIKYNEDKVKNNNSFQGNVYATALFKGKAKDPLYFWIPNNTSDFGNLVQFSYSPYLGFEHENRLKTQSDSSSGNILRGLFRVTASATLFPKTARLRERFEFNFDWQYRNNFYEDVKDLTKSQYHFVTAGFNYAFLTPEENKISAKIGLDYTHGENPSKNFEQQSFYAISLKIKL